MDGVKLKVNPDKTKFIIIGDKQTTPESHLYQNFLLHSIKALL